MLRFSGSEFGIYGRGIRDWGLGIGVWGYVLRIEALGIRVLG